VRETPDDQALLGRFSAERSDDAFRALVETYYPMVLATCRRRIGDAHLAEDAAQAVFLILSRKADGLAKRRWWGRANLADWLFQTARYVSANACREEQRRCQREKEAAAMHAIRTEQDESADWNAVRPHVDAAVDALPARYRQPVVLHYLVGVDADEAAARLGLTRDAFRMRLKRGLDRLRDRLARKGVVLPSLVLGSLLAKQAWHPLASGTAAAVASQVTAICGATLTAGSSAAAGIAASSKIASLAKGGLQMMFWAQVKAACTAAVVAVVLGTPAVLTMAAVAGDPDGGAPPEQAAPAMREPAGDGETPLAWEETGNAWLTQNRPRFGDVRTTEDDPHPWRCAAWRDSESFQHGWEALNAGLKTMTATPQIDCPQVDFGKKMAVALYRQVGGFYAFKVQEVTESHDAVHVKYILTSTARGAVRAAPLNSFQALLVFDRREKPVIIYENGARVAEVLPLQRLENPKAAHPARLGSEAPLHLAAETAEAFKQRLAPLYHLLAEVTWTTPNGADDYRETWLQAFVGQVDFQRNMAMASFKGKGWSSDTYRIRQVLVLPGRLRVDIEHAEGRAAKNIPAWLGDLAACPRRDGQIIFYENGKLIGRNPENAPATAVPSATGKLSEDAAKVIGREGWIVVRSQARMDQLRALFAAHGWRREEEQAGPLSRVDYAKNLVVGYHCLGDVGDTYTVRGYSGTEKRGELDLLRSFIIYKSREKEENRCHVFFAVIPRVKELKVTLSGYTPMNGGALGPTPDKARPERCVVLEPEDGDISDHLRAAIRAEQAEIRPGDDIRLEFQLAYADPAPAMTGEFSTAAGPQPVHVWDGAYSNGYRNHAFLVEMPDGKSRVLRPEVRSSWRKDIPHPVAVIRGKPYVLPGSTYGQSLKSLRELGLKTDQPGVYRITGLYMEEAEETDGLAGRKDGTKYTLWGGNIASNTVEVKVTGADAETF